MNIKTLGNLTPLKPLKENALIPISKLPIKAKGKKILAIIIKLNGIKSLST